MRPTEQGEVQVAIVGAGPVGLSLALGLARRGVRSLVLERKRELSATSRAAGIHVRTREIFQQWGVEQEFLARGTLLQEVVVHSAGERDRTLFRLDFHELEAEADRPGLLILEQGETERLLLDAVSATGLCEVHFAAEVTKLEAGSARPRLRYREQGEEREISADFVVGCDGASSTVREALGLPFEGGTYDLRPMLADVRLGDARDALPFPRVRNDRRVLAFSLRLPSGLWRMVKLDRRAPEGGDEVREPEVLETVSSIFGAGGAEVVWASRFRIHIRSSPRFRVGRFLLAGDAAHVHSPAWGFGMNAGIQDAHNLAWKLAAALNGGDLDRLLDSYEVERQAVVVEAISRYADLITRTFISSPRFIRNLAFVALRTVLRITPLRRRLLRRSAMLDLDYPASPLLPANRAGAGTRLPNPLLRANDGSSVRLHTLLPYAACAILVGDSAGEVPEGLLDRVIRISAGGWEEQDGILRELVGGADGWIVVRPDGHMVGSGRGSSGLTEAAAAGL